MKQGFKKTLDKHNNCEVVIIDVYHRGKPTLIPGLYCANHGTWIKWLSQKENLALKQQGVEYLGSVKQDITLLEKQQQIS